MSRLSTILVAVAMGATLAVGCSSPTETGPTSASRPGPSGDGTVARMALAGPLEGVAVAQEGFAYITQPYASAVARVDLNSRTVTSTIPVGSIPSLVIFNASRTRAYVSNQFSDNIGIIDVASNTQIDTPRVYRQEQLPRALRWETVRPLLRSIDRTTAIGRRDYAMLLLIATYGLRTS